MRLLNTKSLQFSRPFVPNEVPDYAILSHRWTDEEITFADISKSSLAELQSQTRTRESHDKIMGACKLALQDQYEWIWIDSCCIDKSSSAELQEAINSMWRYYADSNICYVYLADVPDSEAGWGPMFAQSDWFTRGWTLQELIAPTSVEFYAHDWVAIGSKFERYQQIAEITAIDPSMLILTRRIRWFSAAEKFSWASHRKVTREEDEAYCLLGLFDVNMPLLYGEGRGKAFVRLQEAIYNATTDHSMFLFRYSPYKDAQPLLADSPTRFCDRMNCNSCLLRFGNPSSSLRYSKIIASERWNTQAHETIITTVTSFGNEASTRLPLLPYEDVSSMLEQLDTVGLKYYATHVMVLNYTPVAYPAGAFCLLLNRSPKFDACRRLQVLPAILPHLGKLASRLEHVKLLYCPAGSIEQMIDRVHVEFSVRSDAFQVETWDAKGTIENISSAQAGQALAFEVQTIKGKSNAPPKEVTCRIYSSQHLQLLLSVQLIHMYGTWSIKEIFERRQNEPEQKLRRLFHTGVLADRCSISLPDGLILYVQIRRLPGFGRACGEGSIVRNRYQISVDFRFMTNSS